MNLPITMDPKGYGNIELSNYMTNNEGITFERYIVNNGKHTFRIDIYEN